MHTSNVSMRDNEGSAATLKCGERENTDRAEDGEGSAVKIFCDAGTTTLQTAPLYPGRFLNELAMLCLPAAKRKGLDFRVEPYTDAHDVIGDEGRLRLIVVSLLANSIKHTASGWVRLAAYPSDGRTWSVLVEDTGQCMVPEEAGRPLEGMHREMTPVPMHGRSLGLAICKRWVEKLHGKILFRSGSANGTHCKVILPVMMREIQDGRSRLFMA